MLIFIKEGEDLTEEKLFSREEHLIREFSEQPRISPKVGILPRSENQAGHTAESSRRTGDFYEPFPRQLKGTVMGHRLDLADIGKVVLRFEPVMAPDYFPQVEIASHIPDRYDTCSF